MESEHDLTTNEGMRAYIYDQLLDAQRLMYQHSAFAFPHFWLWHALFDGTWLCRCWHSKAMKTK